MSILLYRRCLRLLLALSLSLLGGHAIASADATSRGSAGIGATEMAHHGLLGHHARCTDAPPAPQASEDDAQPFKRRRIGIAPTPWPVPARADDASLQTLTLTAPAATSTPPPIDDAIGSNDDQARFLRACRGRAPPAA